MSSYLVMCRSLTYAQRAVRILERSGITAVIAKAPSGLSAEGCTYGIKISDKNFTIALSYLKSAGFNYGKVFVIAPAGEYREVQP